MGKKYIQRIIQRCILITILIIKCLVIFKCLSRYYDKVIFPFSFCTCPYSWLQSNQEKGGLKQSRTLWSLPYFIRLVAHFHNALYCLLLTIKKRKENNFVFKENTPKRTQKRKRKRGPLLHKNLCTSHSNSHNLFQGQSIFPLL